MMSREQASSAHGGHLEFTTASLWWSTASVV